MRVLLDESLPRKLKHEISGHEVMTVPEAGWASKKNGELLRLADAHFDAFVTADRHLTEQQNLRALRVRIVVLRARSNDIKDLKPLIPSLLEVLPGLREGGVAQVGP